MQCNHNGAALVPPEVQLATVHQTRTRLTILSSRPSSGAMSLRSCGAVKMLSLELQLPSPLLWRFQRV